MENSVEETLMEMYLAGASILLVGIIMETQCGLKIPSSLIRELIKRHKFTLGIGGTVHFRAVIIPQCVWMALIFGGTGAVQTRMYLRGWQFAVNENGYQEV